MNNKDKFFYEIRCSNCDYDKSGYCINNEVNEICKKELMSRGEKADKPLTGFDALILMTTCKCQFKNTSKKKILDLLKGFIQIDKNYYLEKVIRKNDDLIFEGVNDNTKRKYKITITFSKEELERFYKCKTINEFIEEYKKLEWF